MSQKGNEIEQTALFMNTSGSQTRLKLFSQDAEDRVLVCFHLILFPILREKNLKPSPDTSESSICPNTGLCSDLIVGEL